MTPCESSQSSVAVDLAFSRILLSEINWSNQFSLVEIFRTKQGNIVLIGVVVCPCISVKNWKSQKIDEHQIFFAVTDFWEWQTFRLYQNYYEKGLTDRPPDWQAAWRTSPRTGKAQKKELFYSPKDSHSFPLNSVKSTKSLNSSRSKLEQIS